ncbi:hypothetical protein EV291_13159 [Rhizobium sp. BK068]|nr:hypothetical protein EV291_13159 [Rhizobium sp. BK068]
MRAFYRRLSARVGKAKAVTATARKIAVLFYKTLRHGIKYSDPGASHYEETCRRRVLADLQRRAKSFGYTLQFAQRHFVQNRARSKFHPYEGCANRLPPKLATFRSDVPLWPIAACGQRL